MLGRSTLLEGAFLNAVKRIYKEKATPELYEAFFQQFAKQYGEIYTRQSVAKSFEKLAVGKGSMLVDVSSVFTKKLFNLMMGYENICNDTPSLSSIIENVNALYNQYAEATSKLDPNKGIAGTPRDVLVGVYLLGEVVKKNHEILVDRQRELQLVAKSDTIFARALEDVTQEINDAVTRKKTKLQLSFFEMSLTTVLSADLEAARDLGVTSHLNAIVKSITSFKDLRRLFNLMAPVAKVKLEKHSDAIDEITNDENNQDLLSLNDELGKALKQITPAEILAFNLKTASLKQNPNSGVSLADIIMNVPPNQAMSTLPSAPPAEGEQDDMAYLSARGNVLNFAPEGVPASDYQPGSGVYQADEKEGNTDGRNTAQILAFTTNVRKGPAPLPSAPVLQANQILVAAKGAGNPTSNLISTPTLTSVTPPSGNITPPSRKGSDGSSYGDYSPPSQSKNPVGFLSYQPNENVQQSVPTASNGAQQSKQSSSCFGCLK